MARNPFAFRPLQVTFWTTVVYLAVFISLIHVHETVPSAPSPDKLPQGINLTEAWSDLQVITRFYHPYNSHENDIVRDYLIRRSREILDRNGVNYTTDLTGGVPWQSSYMSSASVGVGVGVEAAEAPARPQGATLFDDVISNVTYATRGSAVGQYFEGNNFYVYVHGSDDPAGDWWRSEDARRAARGGAGVLVNCHFDSVSTGYGATDDGMSCVSLLQLLSHFTSPGRQPKNGIVLLFNNAEEDGLLGARAFGYSPLVRFCHTFVNLEGAGAGGRAMLFRTTDLETAQAYSKSPHPFGSVVAADAFERGVIKSATDYSVFVDNFGQRGLDIAFFSPRSRYHTEEDDARHTSVDSIWHMLSAALASAESLSRSSSSARFSGPRSDGRKDLIQNGRPTAGVWFDWYGAAWSAFPLRGLFAWTLTLLITTPLTLVIVAHLLVRKDKWYLFAADGATDISEGDGRVPIGGWKGLIRFPLALVVAGGLTVGSVYLLAKVNPLIIYSSSYAVWAQMISLFYFLSWLILRGAHFVRPSALQRGFALFWIFLITWVLSILAAVAEDRMNIGGVYSLAFLHTFAFGAVLISFLEQFALPSKQTFALQQVGEGGADAGQASGNRDEGAEHEGGREDGESAEDAPDATETTPLRAGERGYGSDEQVTTFASTYRRSVSESRHTEADLGQRHAAYENEQSWSGWLPTWTWFPQLLLLGTVYVIVLGNLALVQTTSLAKTGSDGSSLLAPLMGVGVLTIMLLLPLTPFIHRVTHHVPLFLLAVFIVTLIYNSVAFPFSVNNRFKFFFQEVVDIDKGTNVVNLMGLEEFVRPVISSLPTPAGQSITCSGPTVRADVKTCSYDASLLTPDVANGTRVADVVSVEASRGADGKSVRVRVDALNSRTCFLDLSSPVFGFSVEGGGNRDERFGSYPSEGLKHVQLWRRKWEGPWTVTLQLGGGGGGGGLASGREDVAGVEAMGAGDSTNGELKPRESADELSITARCSWSDVNSGETIPAFHEVTQYMPRWAVVTKAAVGLLEVRKTVKVV
ncbi:hypothetical protein UVI_02012440 [Ustilaginoidea virens]|uniref:Peptide hydrolase n=1 Tax=Ustilaginoidea virens TaxID=1159556 RepID=A0A1B5L2D1_USTVR|nr:hypothetical protein UVI_02012440 [Ustilaginoidea virens]